MAKEQTDDGWVCARNITFLAADIGCDRGSIREWIGRESGAKRVRNVTQTKKILRFFLSDYNSSQEVKVYKPVRKAEQSRAELKADIEKEYLTGLRALKIEKAIYEELKTEFTDLDCDVELKRADTYRYEKPSSSKRPRDNSFLRNWFINARKYKKEQKDGSGGKTSKSGTRSEFDSYVAEHGADKWPDR